MHNYLPVKTADYNYTLNIPSQVSMPITGDKTQKMRKYDDGSISVVSASNQSFFEIDLQWSYIKDSNRSIIMDLWHNQNKANGIEKTFYWYNVFDTETYVVRFINPLKTVFYPANKVEISTLTLRIEGKRS